MKKVLPTPRSMCDECGKVKGQAGVQLYQRSSAHVSLLLCRKCRQVAETGAPMKAYEGFIRQRTVRVRKKADRVPEQSSRRSNTPHRRKRVRRQNKDEVRSRPRR